MKNCEQQKNWPLLVSVISIILVSLLLSHSAFAKDISSKKLVDKRDFIVGVSVVPGNWFISMEEDLKKIRMIANTIFVSAGKYTSFQEKNLKPLLDAAQRNGLKVVLLTYKLQSGNTTMENTVAKYGTHPSIIGFKVQDELCSGDKDTAYWINYLSKAKEIIRKYSDKPIMIDVIPWEVVYSERKNFRGSPGSSNSAIDQYINKGLSDYLIVSPGPKLEEVLVQAEKRWGAKTKILIRTTGSYKGDVFNLSADQSYRMANKAQLAYHGGAIGIHYYTWRHGKSRILNPDGGSNSLFENMKKSFEGFRR